MKKHCKVNYETIVPYSDETLFQIIKMNEIEYKVEYLPRPCSSTSDLYAVYYKGIRFSTFAKFLKAIDILNSVKFL
jgi:hypothetical protein